VPTATIDEFHVHSPHLREEVSLTTIVSVYNTFITTFVSRTSTARINAASIFRGATEEDSLHDRRYALIFIVLDWTDTSPASQMLVPTVSYSGKCGPLLSNPRDDGARNLTSTATTMSSLRVLFHWNSRTAVRRDWPTTVGLSPKARISPSRLSLNGQCRYMKRLYFPTTTIIRYIVPGATAMYW
jgi:hypothetical protein